MKIAIIGSRAFSDYEMLSSFLNKFLKNNQINPEEIVSGGAKGADTLAEKFALENNIKTVIFNPDWEQFGRNACSVRNTQIVEYSDIVFAFWDGKSPGTNDSVTKAEKLGKKVILKMFSNTKTK